MLPKPNRSGRRHFHVGWVEYHVESENHRRDRRDSEDNNARAERVEDHYAKAGKVEDNTIAEQWGVHNDSRAGKDRIHRRQVPPERQPDED